MLRYPLIALVEVAFILTVALLVLPGVRVGEGAAGAIVFLGAAVTSFGGVHIASLSPPRFRFALILGGVAGLVMLTFAIVPPRHVAFAVLLDVALVGLAHAAGGSIGRRIQHPGHILPATVVAAAADIVSVVHPRGPTHLIAESEHALSVLAFTFPVPGHLAMAPALGVGDLLFFALLLGAAHAHAIPHGRIAVAALAGALLSGALAATFAIPIPALPAIGAAVLLLTPEMRKTPPRDRTVALGAMVIASVVAASVVVSGYFSSAP